MIQPARNRREPDRQTAGNPVQQRLEQALEFQHGFVVEGDDIDVGSGDAARLQNVFGRPRGKARVVLFAGEALLLSRGDALTVLDESGRRIVIKTGDAENI